MKANGQGLSVDTVGIPFVIDTDGSGTLGLRRIGVFIDQAGACATAKIAQDPRRIGLLSLG